MNRTLILVRHGKSSWDEASLPDRARPLAERGRRDAPMMGQRLAAHQVRPDLILSSPACRALSTATILAEALDYRADIVVDERLYASDARTLLAVIAELGEHWRCVMLVGHDPEFSALAHRLSREISEMPTCAVAQFTFEAASWSAIAAQQPTRVRFDYPKRR